jgi:hypothetical protein
LIQLQSRDLDILRICHEQQFLTLDHIRHFFPNTHRTISYRRLGELKKAQLLTTEYHPLSGNHALIRLTALGHQAVQDQSPFQIVPGRRLNPNTLIHDALATSVRLRLSQIWTADFVPERAIKMKNFPEIPDGIFFFSSGNGIAIEIENSDKGRSRFVKLLARWKTAEKIIFVLYVASHPALFQILKSYLKYGSQDQPIGLVLWDDLKNAFPTVYTCRGEVDLFSRKEF